MQRTLLVDADNLFKIGFHGVRDLYHEGNHIGGIFHFLNVLRKFLLEFEYDKVIVVWDGPNNSIKRKEIYPEYKNNRTSSMTESKKESFYMQKNRVKQYLEEMFVRQITLGGCESDDVIAYYCQISEDEHKTIFSSDKDLTQLISSQVSIYSPIQKKFYHEGEKIRIGDVEIPSYNVMCLKTFLGDKSDNIEGIFRLGEKTFVNYFPEVIDTKVLINDILTKAELLKQDDKTSKVLSNILEGKTKTSTMGLEFYQRNQKLVDLTNPLLSQEDRELIELYYQEDLEPDGRETKNILRYMQEDGIFKYLPKTNDEWVEFVKPFLKLTRKEKRRYSKNN